MIGEGQLTVISGPYKIRDFAERGEKLFDNLVW
jgi:hypothetical protein